MTGFFKIIATVLLSIPAFFVSKAAVPFLSGRIEKELTENDEEFSAPVNPKRVSLIFYVITLILFALSAALSGDSTDARTIIRLASILILICILSIISRLDITYFVIPNGLTLLLLTVAVIVSVLIPLIFKIEAFAGAVDSLIGFLIGGLSLLIINLLTKLILKRDGIGGGDIKLMFAVGLLIGWKLTVFSLLAGFIIGAVCSVVLRLISSGDDSSSLEIPFGPYLSLGSILAVLFGDGIISWYLGLLGF